ncbi:hypothetical protein D8X55_04580 [Malacoplasma penetrans]|uniref:hypothetical protein n=1 Tax=Malacoplasma penetrans TaxID=28227 RepID=UPI0010137961|nr:hypothetical protein [Malacoplasma penetrans]RXY96149.1 hypothetical protein D8X55_04580 [Malacoplasma penetrans]
MFHGKKSIMKVLLSSFATALTGSMIGFAVGFSNINNLASSEIASNYNAANSTRASDTWTDDSLIGANDLLSNPNTPNGYLVTNGTTINMITWFGSQSWSYNLSSSPFLTQISGFNTSKPITSHVYYLAKYDRILVYGTYDTSTTYVFQLNSDGSEYYVNKDDTNKVSNSSLISSSNSSVIGSVGSINLLSTESAIILPKTIDTSTYKLQATKFNLENFSTVAATYDASDLKTSSDAGATSIKTGYTISEIIGLTESSDGKISHLIMKGYSNGTAASTKTVSIAWIKLTNNVFTSAGKIDIATVSETGFNIDNAKFKLVNTFPTSGPVSYVSSINDISNENSIKPGVASDSSQNANQVIEINNNSSNMIKFFTESSKQGSVLDIFNNPYNNRPYVLLKHHQYNQLYFSDLLANKNNSGNAQDYLINIKEWSNFPGINTSNDTSRIGLIWKPIFENTSNVPTVIKGLVSSLTYANGSATPNTKLTRKFTITNFTTSTQQTSSYEDFHATILNSYTSLATENSHLLPQDIDNAIFQKYIYLKSVNGSTTNSPYTSTIIIPKDGLTISNDNGTIKGTVNLNINKWWLASGVYTIPISIDISGLATNSTSNFKIVNNSEINPNKYKKILELQKSKCPSNITAKEILDNFLEFGSSIKLTEANISIVNKTKNASSNTNTNTGTDKYITVTTNDDDGTLSISWNLTQIMSPSVTNRNGSYVFNNFLNLNAWSKITLNEKAWSTLKTSKSPFQVSVADIINSLNLSSGYKTEPQYWIWEPTVSIASNKEAYVKQSIDGNLTGKIKYNKTEAGNVTGNVQDTDLEFTIDSSKGSGFLTIAKLLGGNSTTTLYYNENGASKLASSYDLSKVESDFSNILANSLVFYNSWTTSESMKYTITSNVDSKIVFTLDYKDSIQTNLETGDGSKLVLDAEWISAIKTSNENVLALSSSYSFSYNLTSVQYNNNLNSTNNSIGITAIDESNQTYKKYSEMKPSKFINSFYDKQTNSYRSFLDSFDLVKLPTDTKAINYYYVNDIQLTSNDAEGTVTVYYTFVFPNAGDIEGSSSTSSIILKGFATNQTLSNNWLMICSIAVAVILLLLASGLGSVFFYKKKINTKRINYGIGSKNQELNLAVSQRQLGIFNVHKNKIRNTINGNNVVNTKTGNAKAKQYMKLLKEMKKSER